MMRPYLLINSSPHRIAILVGWCDYQGRLAVRKYPLAVYCLAFWTPCAARCKLILHRLTEGLSTVITSICISGLSRGSQSQNGIPYCLLYWLYIGRAGWKD